VPTGRWEQLPTYAHVASIAGVCVAAISVVVAVLVGLGVIHGPHGPQVTSTTASPNVTDTPTVSPTVATTSTAASGGSRTILLPATVQSWCTPTEAAAVDTCDSSRFTQLVLPGGIVEDWAVHMAAGSPVTLNIPAGYEISDGDGYTQSGANISGNGPFDPTGLVQAVVHSDQ